MIFFLCTFHYHANRIWTSMHSKAHEFLKEKLKSIKAKFYRLNNGRRGEEINYSKLQDMESDWKA